MMFKTRVPLALAVMVVVTFAGCQTALDSTANPSPQGLDGAIQLLEEHADVIVLEATPDASGRRARVVVSPRLQGRIMTMNVGPVESTGYVPTKNIVEGEIHPHMNNFGGLDRFWIGPEAGPFGIYFPPGAEYSRQTWQVPAAFDKGPFPVVARLPRKVVMERKMRVTNYRRVEFQVKVRREVGVIERTQLEEELGIEVSADVAYSGCYSRNTLTNTGDLKWDSKTGLLGIWVLGMFNPTEQCVVIAPLNIGGEGPLFNDDYFGKVTEQAPSRLKVVDGAVIFRADSSRVTKFGLRQSRTTGLAGSFDFTNNLLTIVKFTLPTEPESYANCTWRDDHDPLAGDAFQSYNHGVGDQPGQLAAEPFYELESASPMRELAPGSNVHHRHATYQFHGSYEQLRELVQQLLGVDLNNVIASAPARKL